MDSLKEAIRMGDLRKVKKFIDEGGKVNALIDGDTLLGLAAEGPVWGFEEIHKDGYVGIVKFLLEKGAIIDARDKDGNSALHESAGRYGSGYLKISKILIDAGANLNAANKNGRTPMHRAIGASLETVKLLINAGAEVNSTNNEGKTPLDFFESEFKYPSQKNEAFNQMN